MNTFAYNLKRLRKLHGISQVKLGKDFNFAKSTVCGWENGASIPSLDTIVKLAEYFKVEIAELIEY